MIGMGGLARVGAMIRRGQARLARVMMGRFDCNRCGHPGPHALVSVTTRFGPRFECVSCDLEADQDDVLAALRESTS